MPKNRETPRPFPGIDVMTSGSGGVPGFTQSKYPYFCLFYYYMAPLAPVIHTNTVLMAPEAPEMQ